MGQFGTAKTVLSFLALLGWVLVGVGVIAFLVVLSQFGFLQALSAIIIVAMGMFIVATAQMGLAQIATAENTAELLKVVSGSNGISKQPMANQSGGYATTQRSTAPKVAGDRVKTYKGFEILKAESGVSVNGNHFKNVLEAEKWISSQATE